MKPSLETLADAARERPVPWGAERSTRVECSITRGREHSRLAAPAARFALGGLASVALFACVIRLSSALRDALPLERELAVVVSSGAEPPGAEPPGAEPSDAVPSGAGPRVGTSAVVTPEMEPSELERPVGDGGFADSGQ